MAACRENNSSISTTSVQRTSRGLSILLIGVIGLVGCTSGSMRSPEERPFISKIFRPYRPDIVQGNFISKEQLETIRVGMSKDQVKQLLGTPLLNDIFHADRWDYVFAYKRGDTQQVEQRNVTLTFKGISLAKIDAEGLPSEKELIAEIDALRKNRRPQKPPVSDLDGASTRMAPTVPNPTSGVGIPAGGNRQDAN